MFVSNGFTSRFVSGTSRARNGLPNCRGSCSTWVSVGPRTTCVRHLIFVFAEPRERERATCTFRPRRWFSGTRCVCACSMYFKMQLLGSLFIFGRVTDFMADLFYGRLILPTSTSRYAGTCGTRCCDGLKIHCFVGWALMWWYST